MPLASLTVVSVGGDCAQTLATVVSAEPMEPITLAGHRQHELVSPGSLQARLPQERLQILLLQNRVVRAMRHYSSWQGGRTLQIGPRAPSLTLAQRLRAAAAQQQEGVTTPSSQAIRQPRPPTVPRSSAPVAKTSSPGSAGPPADAAHAAVPGSRPGSSASSWQRSRSRSRSGTRSQGINVESHLRQLVRVIEMFISPTTHPFDPVAAREASITARELSIVLNEIADEVDDINRRNGIVPCATPTGGVRVAAGEGGDAFVPGHSATAPTDRRGQR